MGGGADGAGEVVMNVAAVVINYRTAEVTAQSTHHLVSELGRIAPSHVFLVDNDSRDGSSERLARESRLRGWDGRVTLISADHNGGYGYGINVAVKTALRAGAKPRYFYIINPDAVPRIGSVRTLVSFMDRNPEVGVAGGPVYGPAGEYQGGAFRFPTVKGELEATSHLGLVSRLLGRHAVGMAPPKTTCDVDWVAGTSMIVRREVFERALFDEEFFLYFEEVDFCRRVRQAGWRVAFVADAAVEHIGSVSTGMADQSRRMPAYWFASRRRYLEKHHGGGYARAADVAWAAGYLLFLVKRAATGRPEAVRPQLLRDFLLHSLRRELATTPMPSGGPPPISNTDDVASVGADEMRLQELVLEDLATHDADLLQPGFWAVLAHRLGSRATSLPPGPQRAALEGVHRTMSTAVDWVWGIKIPRAVKLGRRVRLWHSGCMLLDAKSIGNDVHIRQDTTFGVVRGRVENRDQLPVIGDRADIGSGACVLGPVRVGADAIVGANSVVMKSVAPKTTVLGVPARVIPT
ncbi:MAG TPA: glycosyltransferase [Polyangia bacterium]